VTLHVYALTERPATLPAITGIEASELETVEVGELDAIVSPVAGEEANEAAVLAHAGVVDGVFARNAAVLPVRFGTGFSDAASLSAAIGGRVDKLQRALELVRGNVEIGLRVGLGTHPETPRTGSGRDYLTGRLARVRAAERAAGEIHGPLAGAAHADTVTVLPTPELLLSAAYLVARDEVDAFRKRIAELDGRHPELTFVCTGPWPPYSFATVDTGP